MSNLQVVEEKGFCIVRKIIRTIAGGMQKNQQV